MSNIVKRRRSVAVVVGVVLVAVLVTSCNVYTAAENGTAGIESSMAFVPTADPDLFSQLENQQGSDADSTTYSQAFQLTADGTVNRITWWGTGSSQTGFLVALHDGVWPTAPYANLPNGPAVYGTLAYLGVVPIASVTQTPAANGMTRYDLAIPSTAMGANRPYRLSVTAIGGSFQWERSAAAGCCTGTQAVSWVRGRTASYLGTSNVAFSLDQV